MPDSVDWDTSQILNNIYNDVIKKEGLNAIFPEYKFIDTYFKNVDKGFNEDDIYILSSNFKDNATNSNLFYNGINSPQYERRILI